MFYLKLAMQNIRKSLPYFFPFLLATTIMFTMILTVANITYSKNLDQLANPLVTKRMLTAGVIICTFMSVIIISYSYRFLLKQRTKEFALYQILGLNKRNIWLISSLELVSVLLATLFLGTIFSLILSQFCYLVLTNLIGEVTIKLTIGLSAKAFVITLSAFLIIFLLLMFFASRTIRRHSAISLLNDNGRAEREPRGRLILSVISVVMLATGYYLASLTSAQFEEMLLTFFIAVLLVISGTYLFYLAVTISVLKWQKAKKTYYYQPKHFIRTSSMLYRMKTNAVGLANITILVMMTFVLIATTTSLYVAGQQMIKEQFPKNTELLVRGTDIASNKKTLSDLETENQIDTKRVTSYSGFEMVEVLSINEAQQASFPVKRGDTSNLASLYFVTKADLEKMGNTLPSIIENQVLMYTHFGKQNLKTLDWYGKRLTVTQESAPLKNFPKKTYGMDTFIMVVSTEQELIKLNQLVVKYRSAKFGKDHDDQDMATFFTTHLIDLSEKQQDNLIYNGKKIDMYVKTINKEYIFVEKEKVLKAAILAIIGGFLFLGFLLSVTFILATVLIVYYKQISEGTEDKRSYHILQEVGLSKQEVKQTINSQVLIVFFMPVIISIAHFLACFTMIKKLISLFGVTSMSLVGIVSAISIAVISLIYFIIYRKTSNIYYKIVER